jgi:uncharacterized protein
MTNEAPTPDSLPLHPEVQDDADALALGADASELHGSLCGYLCGGGQSSRSDWLSRLAIEGDAGSTPSADSALDRLYQASCGQLGDPGLGFELLLPDDDAPLEERTEALLSWCRGFLGGFGLAAGAEPALGADAAEALEDLSRIAASSVSLEDADADEDSLMEISEFVRVAAMLLYGDSHMQARARGTLH